MTDTASHQPSKKTEAPSAPSPKVGEKDPKPDGFDIVLNDRGTQARLARARKGERD